MKKPIKEIILKEEGIDIKGTRIPKNTRLFVMKIGTKAPFGEKHRIMVVRVDNGTGHLDLYPETAVRDTEINFEEVKNEV